MKNTLKKLIPYALVGVISGATTFGAINYFGVKTAIRNFPISHQRKTMMPNLHLLI